MCPHVCTAFFLLPDRQSSEVSNLKSIVALTFFGKVGTYP